MNYTQQRILLAEFHTPETHTPGTGRSVRDEPIWLVGSTKRNPITCPDYHRDLNAAQEIIDKLDHDQYRRYLTALDQVTVRDARKPASMVLRPIRTSTNPVLTASRFASATAAQKCEAVLRAIGKWDDPSRLQKPFTVVLRYPDYIVSTEPDGQYIAFVVANDPNDALVAAQDEATSRSPHAAEVLSARDFDLAAMIEGHATLIPTSLVNSCG